ncbi:MAG: phage baseplate assembly protein V [Gemmatimonadaceae bacterium]
MDVLERLMSAELTQARERPIFGVVTGRVTRINDDNSYEVEYLSMGQDEPSSPARVMMPMAGAGRGTYFHPLVGDEVVIAFELGNVNLPIILGGVWNENDAYPGQARQSPDNDVRTIVSRSGHELTFDDAPGRGKVTLKTQSGHTVELDDTAGVGKVTITSAGGRSIVLDDTPAGSITLSTPAGVELQMQDAGGQLSIRAPMQISLESTLITLRAATINLTTTGTPKTSLVVIDSLPYGVHTHYNPGMTSPLTGPVFP